MGKTVWYRFVPPVGGTLIATSVTSSFDTALAVYQGTSLSDLSERACNDKGLGGTSLTATLSLPVNVGQTYYLQAGGVNGTGGRLSLGLQLQPSNAGVVVGPAPIVVPSGRVLSATLSARAGCGTIEHIQFGNPGSPFSNARVTVVSPSGGPSDQTASFTYTPPAGTASVILTIQRVAQSGGATVSPIRFYDGCGEWTTFVGGGASAFQ